MLSIPNQLEGAYVGQDVALECHTEAYPTSINYWTTERGDMIVSGEWFTGLTFRVPCIVIYSYTRSRSQKDALFLSFILVNNSTCFGQTYCPSSGVLILYSQKLVLVVLVMLTVC